MASFADPQTDLTSHMGGEGLTWAGASPFTTEPHVFVNLGDGTYNHSGSLAIRASMVMGSHITYKLLYNDAVAMTGGQHPESGFSVAQITRQLAAEGVKTIVVVAEDASRYESVADLAPGVQVHPRSIERALARHRGRPSVTGGSARTPSLTVRVPPETRTALEELARAQGKRLADVSREALDEYVSRHAS